jgi:putative DNA primase/helicase
MRMPIKFMLLSNEAPAINDASGALPRRFIVLQCTQSFFGKEDHGLEDKLLAELPGILLWSLEGLARLRARGHGFVQPASAAEMIQHMQDLGSPVSVFLRECCELGPDKTADAGQLYDAWYHWCRDGGQKPSNRAVFGRDLAATVTGLRIGRAWSSEGPRARRYVGVGLLPSAEKGAESPDGFEVIDLSDLGL